MFRLHYGVLEGVVARGGLGVAIIAFFGHIAVLWVGASLGQPPNSQAQLRLREAVHPAFWIAGKAWFPCPFPHRAFAPLLT